MGEIINPNGAYGLPGGIPPPDDMTAVTAALAALPDEYVGLASTALTPNLVFDGDSMTAGTGSTETLNFVNQTVDGLDPRRVVYNIGIGGQLFNSMYGNAAANVDPKFAAGMDNIVSAFGGSNDLRASYAVATVYGNIRDYHLARRAVGWRTVAYTVMPRSDAGTPPGFEAARQELNALIVANWATFADALVDIGNDPVMGAAGVDLNTTYFADLVHPTNAGYTRIASFVRRALVRLGVLPIHPRNGPATTHLFIPPSRFSVRAGTPTLTFTSFTQGWLFPDAAASGVIFTQELPPDWNTFAMDILWSNISAAAGNVRFDSQRQSVIVGTALSTSTAVSIDAVAGAQNTPVLSVGIPATGVAVPTSRLLAMHVQRNGAHANDTLAGSVHFQGVFLRKVS